MTITTIEYTANSLAKDFQGQFLNLNEDQVEEADTHGHSSLVNICMDLTSNFNKSSIIRASNAFLCRKTYLVSEDSVEAVNLDVESFEYSSSLSEIVDNLHKEGYFIWAVDNIDSYGPQNIFDVELPEKSAFVYGRENDGLYAKEIELCDGMIYIPMAGAARSLNVAQAAAATMSEYTRQHRFSL